MRHKCEKVNVIQFLGGIPQIESGQQTLFLWKYVFDAFLGYDKLNTG